MGRGFGVLPYSTCSIGDGFLAVSNFGSWCKLTRPEFTALDKGEIERCPGLLDKLRKSGMVAEKGNIRDIVRDYRGLNRFLMQGPSLHIVVPTLRCNQQCVYCHAKAPDERRLDMDKKTATRVLDFIFKTHSQAVTIEFQGGEPLLNWDIVRYMVKGAKSLNEKFEHKDLKLTIVSNLTLLDEHRLDFLTRNGVSICTSLDGPEHVHDANRRYLGGGPTYKDVVKWVDRINDGYEKHGMRMRLNALPTITRHSLPHWKGIIDEYVRLGFDTIHLRFLNRLGAAKENWERIAYSPEQFSRFWEKSMDYIIRLNGQGVGIRERMATVMLAKILLKRDDGLTELMSPCGAGRTQMLYNHNGDIYTCDEGRMLGSDLFRLGSVLKDDYKDVIRSDKLVSVCYASVLENYCGPCAFKPFCGTCPVMNFAEQGTVVPKITATMRCKIYKSQFLYLFNRVAGDSGSKKALQIFKRWVHEGKDQEEAA